MLVNEVLQGCIFFQMGGRGKIQHFFKIGEEIHLCFYLESDLGKKFEGRVGKKIAFLEEYTP